MSHSDDLYHKILEENKDLLTIGSLFFSRASLYKDKLFTSYWNNDQLIKLSWKDFSSIVINKIQYLLDNKISQGDLIAIISENSPEMLAYKIAITSIGAICCPIHKTLSEKQKINLLKEYNPRLILVSNKEYNLLKEKVPENITCINFGTNHSKTTIQKKTNIDRDRIKNMVKKISPDDLAYIMLSSGTTGQQKGIELTHKNILINQIQVKSILNFINENDYYLSFLPFSHSYGGLAEIYQVIFNGSSYHFCKGTDTTSILNEINDIKPTVFQCVPRIWEKLFKILTNDQDLSEYNHKINSLKSIKTGFSAGARLNNKVVEYFYQNNLPIYQGYGLTECSPSIAIASPLDIIKNNYARILPEIHVKISEESEIIAKGPNTSPGYYKQPEANKHCFDNGYIKTGDHGEIIDDHYLRLIGRKNNLLVLSTGEKVITDKIEEELGEHALVSNGVLTGNDLPYTSCIVIVDTKNLHEWASGKNIVYNNLDELISKEIVYNEFEKIIDQVNQNLSEVEKIKKFILTLEEITEDELTPTLKIKRDVFERNRKDLIQKLYSTCCTITKI